MVNIHQYQQSEQSPLTTTIEHKNTVTYDVGNPGLAWDRHKHVVGLNHVNGISLDN